MSMKPSRTWSKSEIIAALQAAAVDGVAPSSATWRLNAADRPSKQVVAAVFGGWRIAVAEAGLRSAWEAPKRANDGPDAPPREGARASRERERREQRVQQMREEIDAGRLVVRQASPEDMARWAAERAARCEVPQ